MLRWSNRESRNLAWLGDHGLVAEVWLGRGRVQKTPSQARATPHEGVLYLPRRSPFAPPGYLHYDFISQLASDVSSSETERVCFLLRDSRLAANL